MKTTIEIPDALLAEARRAAEKQGVTLRALMEAGLRKMLREGGSAGFRLRRATFRGRGLQDGVQEGDWERIRDLAYKGRGA
jgi:Arc/MetJ family transcription regulator